MIMNPLQMKTVILPTLVYRVLRIGSVPKEWTFRGSCTSLADTGKKMNTETSQIATHGVNYSIV